MAKRKDKADEKTVAESKSPLEVLQARADAKDTKKLQEKVAAGVPELIRGLYDHLKSSGTGKDKLEFLLSLDFGKEKNKKKIAEAAAIAFDNAGYSLTTVSKILKYSQGVK